MLARFLSRSLFAAATMVAGTAAMAQNTTVAQFSDLTGSLFRIKASGFTSTSKAKLATSFTPATFSLSVPAFGLGTHYNAYLTISNLAGGYTGTSTAGSFSMHAAAGGPATLAFWDALTSHEIMAVTFHEASLSYFGGQFRGLTAMGSDDVQFFGFAGTMPHYGNDTGNFAFTLANIPGTNQFGGTFNSSANAPTPEPVTTLLGIGAAGLFLRRRLRSR